VNTAPSDHRLAAGLLTGLALPLSVYLCVALTQLGLEKYHYILAGGQKFATFPNQASHLGISWAYLGLMLVHLAWVWGRDRSLLVPTFAGVLRRTAVFLVLAWVAYPLGNDIYLYLHVGLMNLSKVDPYLVPAGDFWSPLTPFVDWKQTSTYGPISQLFFTLSAATAWLHPIVAVYGFKTICLVTHVCNGYLVWWLLPEPQRGKGAIAYLLCPLLLFEQVCSAHVDVFVSTSILLTALCLAQRHYATAFLGLWGGFLAKTVPLIWLPLLGLFLLRQRQWRALAWGLVASVAVVAVLTVTVLPTVAAWRSLLNPGVVGQYQASIHALVRALLETLPFFLPDAPKASEYRYFLLQLAKYTLSIFAAFYTWTIFRIFQRSPYTTAVLLEDMGWVAVVLMVYSTSWLMPWYVSSLYAIASLLPGARLFNLTVLLFGLSSSASYWLQNDSGLRSLVSIGLPTLALLLGPLVLRSTPKTMVSLSTEQ